MGIFRPPAEWWARVMKRTDEPVFYGNLQPELPVRYLNLLYMTEARPFVACLECGLLVYDVDTHERFHARLDWIEDVS